jgi:hypothetical protein
MGLRVPLFPRAGASIFDEDSVLIPAGGGIYDITLPFYDNLCRKGDLLRDDPLNGVGGALVPQSPFAAVSAVMPERFGAVGDGETDDHDALQEALDYAAENGAEVWLSPKIYACENALNIDDTFNVRLRASPWMNLLTSAEIRYTGVATASSFLSARRVNGLTMERVRLSAYPSGGSFTGRLLDLRGTVPAPSALLNLSGCAFHVAGDTGTLIALANTYNCTFRDLLLGGCAIGIHGLEGGSDFSNAMTFENLTFALNRCTTCQIKNPGESWSITGSSFEALVGGGANGIESVTIAKGLRVTNCWFGDTTGDDEGTWIKGCLFGAVITANSIQTYANPNIDAIYLGAGGTGVEGVVIEGNFFSGSAEADLRYAVKYATTPVPRKVRVQHNAYYLVDSGLDTDTVRGTAEDGQSIPDTTDTLVELTGTGFVSNKRTITAPGKYAINALVELSQADGFAQCFVYKDGDPSPVLVSRGLRSAFSGDGLTASSLSDVVTLAAGDVLGLYVYRDWGSAVTVYTARMSIAPVFE